ncbi:hypothetical protein FOQG_16324 [Fusarium oxysporum f. sp. raphani 54005]|uniref:NAD-dependent epimerase/dehydratase domain-containing protein n=1 Tax=Fusarium oxysporum f. sp. raphani 54005 TaxID=1089458 RepID=X0BB77_FUSOX|nr:hypothetical protein FOQG_16324 [Fusarium oxysporum f. sp. raphani 54005]
MPLQSVLPKGSWILVTGATGFIASHTVKTLLDFEYKVRGTVRDREQASWLLNIFPTNFELIEVKGSISAIKGMSAAAHVATNNESIADPNMVIPQTVKGVTSMLEAAL